MTRLGLFVFILCMTGPISAQDFDFSNVETKIASQLFQSQLKMAEQGYAEAMYALAGMYEEGYGTPQNLDKALSWYRTAAGLGYDKAIQKIPMILERKRTGAPGAVTTSRKAPPPRRATTPEENRQDILVRQQQLLDAARVEAEQRAVLLQKQLESEHEAAERARKEAEEAKRQQQLLAQEKAAALKASEKTRIEAERARQLGNDVSQFERDSARERVAQRVVPDTGVGATAVARTKPDDGSSGESSTAATPDDKVFQANPCNGPAARFMSTCR